MTKQRDDYGQGWADFERALEGNEEKMTPAARTIAAYFREHRASIPYETGAGFARAIGVSEMTVIRFVRDLGYANLRELKDSLRPRSGNAEALDDVRERFTNRDSDLGHLTKSLGLELDAVQRAYEMTATEQWSRIVELLGNQDNVFITGFQASRGVAMDFSSRLKYVRPGVRFAEGTTGVYSEVLECNSAESVLVIIDTASYARKGVQLAKRARELNIPLVIVTDRFSHWARAYTDNLLEMTTHVGTFWDSTASLSVILNLLTHTVASRMGDPAMERFHRMVELGKYFKEFDQAASRGKKRFTDMLPD